MKSRIEQIGDECSVSLPKAVLRASGLDGDVDVRAEKGRIIICQGSVLREGWREQFKSMADAGDDHLLWPDDAGTTEWDDQEWQW